MPSSNRSYDDSLNATPQTTAEDHWKLPGKGKRKRMTSKCLDIIDAGGGLREQKRKQISKTNNNNNNNNNKMT